MTDEPQDEWVTAMQNSQKQAESFNRDEAEYTKDCCPCHRCKKIVAEKEEKIAEKDKEVERLRGRNAILDNRLIDSLTRNGLQIAKTLDREATISRLRELLKESRRLSRFGGTSEAQRKLGIIIDKEIEVRNE